MMNKKSPEIRFKGFTDDWEQRKFKDFIYKAGKKNTNDDDFPAYSVSNKFGLVRQSEHFNESRLDDLDKTAYKLVNPGEFAYNPARINVGSIAFNNLPETVIVSSLYVVLKMNNKLDNEYILQFIKSRRFTNEVIKNTEGSVREYLFFDNFKNIKFPYINSKEEQAKIGGLFRQLDETIALHQDAIQRQQYLKKALLQKLFPVNGEGIPTVRFATFKEEWEQRKLQEILKVNSGRDYKHLGSGSIPVYGTGGYMLSVNDKLSDKDAIGIGRKGTIDKPQYLKAPFWTVDTLFFMTPLNNFDLQFLYTMTQKINWKKMDESTGVPSLSKAVIEKINQNIPSYQEQIVIGRFFKQLDETIVLHQDAIHKLQLLKQSLLQKMFVN